MIFAVLMKEILRTFDRACHQLRVKHHIKRINTKMSFRFLISPIHLYGIAHGLKSMKGKADRQQNLQVRNGVRCSEGSKQFGEILIQKIVVLKKCKYAHIGNNTDYKKGFSSFSGRFFNIDPGYVINNYGESQNKNVNRHKHHIKIAAGRQQQQPPETVRQKKIKGRNNRKKNKKMYRVE